MEKKKLPNLAHKSFLNRLQPVTFYSVLLTCSALEIPWVVSCLPDSALVSPALPTQPQVNIGSFLGVTQVSAHTSSQGQALPGYSISNNCLSAGEAMRMHLGRATRRRKTGCTGAKAMLPLVCSQPMTKPGGTVGQAHSWKTGDFTISCWLQDTPIALPNVRHSALHHFPSHLSSLT